MTIDLSINDQEVIFSFNRIANDLMNSFLLMAGEKTYRIAEIEFYLKSDEHDDPYTHGNKRQLEYGKWYFHGSGLDLTFGKDGFHGGILIRAIYDIYHENDTDGYFYGPIVSVAELFGNLGDIRESSFAFGLIPAKDYQLEYEKPIAAPRVGLNPNNPHMDSKKYHDAFYRFLIMPKRKHGEKYKIAEAMKTQGCTPEEIDKIWG